MSQIVRNFCTLGPVSSAQLGNERPIYVWLPASYGDSEDRNYPVLYMQDGFLLPCAPAFERDW